MKISSDREYGSLYYLNDDTLHSSLTTISPFDTPLQWHHRLGHPSLQKLRQVIPIESSLSKLECESCQLGWHRQASYSSRVNNRSSSLFDLVHLMFGGHIVLLSFLIGIF